VLEYRAKPLRISLTPLIDVVFILLLFFMLASTFYQWQQMTLSSVAKGKPAISEKFPKQIFVQGGNVVRHNGVVYTLEDAAFNSLLNQFFHEQVILLVTAETPATVQDVVAVMDSIIAAGIENVSLTRSFDER